MPSSMPAEQAPHQHDKCFLGSHDCTAGALSTARNQPLAKLVSMKRPLALPVAIWLELTVSCCERARMPNNFLDAPTAATISSSTSHPRHLPLSALIPSDNGHAPIVPQMRRAARQRMTLSEASAFVWLLDLTGDRPAVPPTWREAERVQRPWMSPEAEAKIMR
jgi:hypothetical protein